MRFRRTITGILISVLIMGLTAGSTAAAENTSDYYPPSEHADIKYSDMKYTGVETAEIEKLVKELDEVTSGKSNPP